MCGRFTLTPTGEELRAEFGPIELPFDYRPRFNIAPTQDVLALVAGEDGPRAGSLRWGLVPPWADDPSIGNRLINARAETIAGKPAFRDALRRRRCLVLADGFYEWRKEGKLKVPVRIRRRDGRPFAFAAIRERWRRDDADPVHSCAIVTTDAIPYLRPVHARMPVILPAGAREAWLDPATDPEEALALLRPRGEGELEAYPVDRRVNSPANDDPACIEPVGPPLPEPEPAGG